MRLDTFLLRMPKVELHVHLEGCLRPATLLELARKNGVRLPADNVAGVRRWLRFRDLPHFLEIYDRCSSCLRNAEDFHLLALDFLAEQAVQNVVYSEAHFTIGTHLARGVNGAEVAAALAQAASEGESRFGVRVRWITDIVRGQRLELADRTLEWALAHRERGVVALGLSGPESHPAHPYARHFAAAAAAGLRCVAHAGETGSAGSIRSVLEHCRPERIGHGLRLIDDEALIDDLRQRQLPIEICPSSNLALGLVGDLCRHPVATLRERGLAVTINSDDPPLFGTNLTREYLALQRAFGWSGPELARLALDAVAHTFLPPAEKTALADDFLRQLCTLVERYRGDAVELD